MQFEDGTHRVNVGFKEFEVNVLVTTQGINFFEFMIELESDFVVVQCIAFDVFKFLPNKSVNFEALRLLFGNLIDNMFPSVKFLSILEFLVENLDLWSCFWAKGGWDLRKELFGHGVIGRFFWLLEKLGCGWVVLDDYKFGVGVNFVDNEVRKHVLGNGGNLLTWGNVLLDTYCELLGRVENWNL